MNSTCRTVLVASLAVFALAATARLARAEKLSRASAIARAMAKNPQVDAQRALVDKARAVERQVRAGYFPDVAFTMGVGPSLEADRVPGTAVQSRENNFSDVGLEDLSVVLGGQLTVTQPIYTFGKLGLRRDAAGHGVRARSAQVVITEADVAFAVAELYENYLFARDARLVFEEIDHTIERSIEATQQRLAGTNPGVSEQDLLRLEVARSAARVGLSRAVAGFHQAEEALRASLVLPAGEPIETVEVGLEPIGAASLELDALTNEAAANRPELVALKQGELAHDRLAAAEQASYLPDLFGLVWVNGAWTPNRDWVGSRYVVDPLQHFVPGALIGLRWTFQGGMGTARADENRAEAARLRNLSLWAKAALPAQVRRAYEDVERARRDIEVTGQARTKAKQWVVRAGADYDAGLGDSRALSDALEGYVAMRLGEMDAMMRFNVGMARLAQATGRLVAGGLYP